LLLEDKFDLIKFVGLFNSSGLGLFVVNLCLSEVGNELGDGGDSLSMSFPGLVLLVLGNSKLTGKLLKILLSGSFVNNKSFLFLSGGHLIFGSSNGGSDLVIFELLSTFSEGVLESGEHSLDLVKDGSFEI